MGVDVYYSQITLHTDFGAGSNKKQSSIWHPMLLSTLGMCTVGALFNDMAITLSGTYSCCLVVWHVAQYFSLGLLDNWTTAAHPQQT